jgi:hypothetical protein
MTSQALTIDKLSAALEVLLIHDAEMNCLHKFSQIMDEIIMHWRSEN